MQNIFVYGTLKRGQQRAAVMADQEFLLEASTMAEYWMFNLGSFPGLVDREGQPGDSIAGEVYRVDVECRRRLDEIECVDEGLYELREIRLNDIGSGDSISEKVFAYFYLGPTQGCVRLKSWPGP